VQTLSFPLFSSRKKHVLTIMNASEVGGVWKIMAGVSNHGNDGDVSTSFRAIPPFSSARALYASEVTYEKRGDSDYFIGSSVR
jgi:hypothetical protein